MDGDQYSEALERFRSGVAAPAEVACAFLLSRVRAKAGSRWRQGERKPPLPCDGLAPAVRVIAESRLSQVVEPVARALVGWGRGERVVELRFDVPAASHVLSLQARGARCVSLLADDADTGAHEGPLAFALHDLCHLEKFNDPEHHEAQVGFFAVVDRAIGTARWAALDARFDDAWRSDLEHVVADMNGSPVFLFAALKMKLKMATRRELAGQRGASAPTFGPLDEGEARAFGGALDEMLDALALPPAARDAARAITTKRDAHDDARTLVTALTAVGREVLLAEGVRRQRAARCRATS